ncbi:MAG: molybdenum cofactor biosynthesis protein MoaE [Gammaproteobacteria bacterium]|nr:molybdenum cofactor biosynthesis protein MoaE [Gammaproteobacteria bacterium]
MSRFAFSREDLSPEAVRQRVMDPASGAYVAFEGWVRNHNEGHDVLRLEYEAYEGLGVKEGERIIAEAEARFGIQSIYCVHRLGELGIADMAVLVGVSTPHRAEAFEACRFIIDEVKHRVPIWKKEYYSNGDSGWVNCERCSASAEHQHDEPNPDSDSAASNKAAAG